MKHLTCLLLLAGIAFTTQAQTVDDYQPDADGDGCVGMSDLLSLLSVFGSCEAQAFACGDPVSYQGYDYATVLIGEQCWFAENLRSESYENGDAIQANLIGDSWATTSSGAVADYYENDSLIDNYGRLYNWHAVDDARGLCPSGWHVPTDEEWTVMTDHLGGSAVAGGPMKTTYGWPNGGNGSNSSGFSGLPGGYCSFGTHVAVGTKGFWWSSTPGGSTTWASAWARKLEAPDQYSSGEGLYRPYYVLQLGASIRCIQDTE